MSKQVPPKSVDENITVDLSTLSEIDTSTHVSITTLQGNTLTIDSITMKEIDTSMFRTIKRLITHVEDDEVRILSPKPVNNVCYVSPSLISATSSSMKEKETICEERRKSLFSEKQAIEKKCIHNWYDRDNNGCTWSTCTICGKVDC
jgi:hypothetical protein